MPLPRRSRTLGSTQVYTDDSGNAPLYFSLNTALASGTVVATATDDWGGDTSEFSAPVALSKSAAGSVNQRFVFQAYLDLLHRPADAGGQAAFTSFLDNGGTRASVATAITGSTEYRTLVVTELFNRLLFRLPDAAALNYYVPLIAQGGTIEQCKSAIVGSYEYFFTNCSFDNDKFVISAFSELVGRKPDAAAKAFFNGQLNSADSRAVVAAQLANCAEAAQYTVDSHFQQYLHRPADPAAKSLFGNQLQNGLHDEALVTLLLASAEYSGNL